MAQVDITYLSSYYLVFEGKRGTSFNGDIALDDISVASGSCATQAVSTTTISPPLTTACKELYQIYCGL
ncbi:hypothetical protein DPMN_011724 [Dreissena polymorpha]|uniref:MAM domain-containing protein n=1 Tax=Dreissena polymorpha TaxID=45954 RepID=A0A9D4N266_DREPO|nr:hypothetical protein DPMN_011724 [Dreissena polymorpha]